MEIRKPGKKRLQSGQAATSSENLPKKIKQEVPEVVKKEERPETGNGPTMIVFYGQVNIIKTLKLLKARL